MCCKPVELRRSQEVGGQSIRFIQPVPCGKCNECKAAKVKAWIFRIEKELERSMNPLFVTLTYEDKDLPISKDGRPTLCKRDLQLFFKTLRKCYEKNSTDLPKLKYFAVGEYGKKYGRPHYHIILLNCLCPDIIHSCWGHGIVDIPPLKNGGIGYVLKYISKSNFANRKGIQSEFSLCSKGLGSNYLTPQMIKYHLSRVENCYIITKGGYKMSIPKYYKEKIYTDEEARRRVTVYLEQRNAEHLDKLLNKYRRRYPNRDNDFYYNMVAQQKKLRKLVPRFNEVF